MSDKKGIYYLSLRKEKCRISEHEAWNILESPDTPYGFLGTHGVKEEGNMPYVVPMNFVAVRDENAIYLHTTLDQDSKRNCSIIESPDVCFTVVHPGSRIVPPEETLACNFSMSFASVISVGKIEIIEKPDEKARILNLMMDQKAAAWPHDEVLEHMALIVKILKINISFISGARKE